MQPHNVLDSRFILLVSIAITIAGCGKKQEAPTAQSATVVVPAANAPEGQVDIVAWPGYIENGSSDPNYNWVTKFEQDSGCKVNVKTAGTSYEMVSLMTQGGYDLVTAVIGSDTRDCVDVDRDRECALRIEIAHHAVLVDERVAQSILVQHVAGDRS